MSYMILPAADRLQKRVEEGSFKLVNAVGVPRSMSTAFCRALNESDEPSIYINEPINRENRSVERAAAHILAAADVVTENPLLVIVKNMASYIDLDAFTYFEGLSQVTLWHIRHPLQQLNSLLTRVTNDLYAAPGEDTIDGEEIYDYIDDATQFLIKSPKSHNFSKTGWESIASYFQSRPLAPRCVVDGSQFVADPVNMLAQVCNFVDIEPNPRMVSGWRRDFVNVINLSNPDETARSAWTSVAAQSQGIKPKRREPLDLDRLPSALLSHINEVALPTYSMMVDYP